MQFGGLEILIIFAVIALIFGPKQIPKLARAIKDSSKVLKEETKPEVIEDKQTDSET